MHVRLITRFLLGLWASLGASLATAQTDPGSIERTIPQVDAKPVAQKQRVATPSAPAQPEGRVAGSFVLSAVNVEGATVFSSAELAESFEPYLANRVSQIELDKIAAGITDRYRRAGYVLSYAMIPEQSVQSGIVRVRIIEGFVDRVRIQGDKRSAAAVRQLFERLQKERPLRKGTLERTLGLVRDVPGVVLADTRISRTSKAPAHHQLTITLRADRSRAIAYVDNRGTVDGARVRGYSSFSAASVAIPGDQLQIDVFSIPSGGFRFLYGMAKASIPLNTDGLRLSLSASRGDQFRRLQGPDQDGKSRQLIADLSYPLVESRAWSLVGHASIGDWKSEERRADALIQRDRLQVTRAWVEISRGVRTRIDGRVGISRGLDLGAATENGDPLASRPYGRAKFTKLNVNLQVVTPLATNVILRVDTAAQYSTRPLLAPEEFALGGSRIGRAFDFNEATGDHGIGAMLEVSYRPKASKSLPKSFELFAFVDGGGAFRKRASPGLRKEEWLAGTGVGARLSTHGFLVSGEVGVPIARTNTERGARAFFSIVRAF